MMIRYLLTWSTTLGGNLSRSTEPLTAEMLLDFITHIRRKYCCLVAAPTLRNVSESAADERGLADVLCCV